ncbi:hypothetical protein GRB70_27190 [Bradyrhizobium neotropicale]|nr:hypothetical protein [Bradyrhizobium neotropicale]
MTVLHVSNLCVVASFRGGPQDRTRNLEILRCAIAHRSSMLRIAPERRSQPTRSSIS